VSGVISRARSSIVEVVAHNVSLEPQLTHPCSAVLGVHPKNGELSARDIHLIKEAPRAPERTEWIRREIDSSKLTRYSKGPDGTKGFTLGRGTHLPASKDSSAF